MILHVVGNIIYLKISHRSIVLYILESRFPLALPGLDMLIG